MRKTLWGCIGGFSLLTLLATACVTSETGRTEPEDAGSTERYRLVVLGVAQDGGLPHLGCVADCCAAARRSGRRVLPASLGVFDVESGATLLLDAGPAVEEQLGILDRHSRRTASPRRPVDGVVLTHAHIGHYAGLIQFGREVASTLAVPTYVSSSMAAYLSSNGPWSQLVELGQLDLCVVEDGVAFEPLPDLFVTPIAVPHRDEYSDTFAFRIRGPSRTALFVPDIDRWDPQTLSRLLDGVDLAYLDGTFYDGRELPGRSLDEIPHPPMVRTMELLAAEARRDPDRFRFLHLNHTNPALNDEAIAASVRERGFRIARREEVEPL